MEQDRVGQKLGNYLLLSILGSGGFATVYLGEHIYLKTQAAIKVLKTLELTDKARDKFLKEARTIARLTHPHIIRVIECGVDVGAVSSTPYIVMSYAARGNIRNDYPQGTILPLDIILSYLKQAAEALQYAHDQDIVHCDVKPENMLIGSPNQILLADFGIANVSHTADTSAAQNNIHSDPTISGDIQGTVTYMAPERFQSQIRRSSDQYSLGIMVYEWLTGDPPFTGSRNQVMFQHLTAQPHWLSGSNPHVSPEIEQVVLKALEKDPISAMPP